MTISSSTDVCNIALDLLSAGTINDVENPQTPTEELLSRWYTITRQKLLREHPWNFAIGRHVAAASSTSPAFGYDKKYPLPADFLRLLYIAGDGASSEVILNPQQYQVEDNAILTNNEFTNSSTVNVVYVRDFTDIPRFDPSFTILLAHELALNVAYKITETGTNVERLAAIKQEVSRMAKAIDGQERPPTRVERSKNLRSRRSGLRNTHRIEF